MQIPDHLNEALSQTSILSIMNASEEAIGHFLKTEFELSDPREIALVLAGRDEVLKVYRENQPEIDAILEQEEDEEVFEKKIRDLLAVKQASPMLIDHIYLTSVIASAVKILKPLIIQMIRAGASEEEVSAHLASEGVDADYIPLLYAITKSELIANGEGIAVRGMPGMTILAGVIILALGGLLLWIWGTGSIFSIILLVLGGLILGYGMIQSRR